MDAVARPSVMRTVSRMSVTLDKRRYFDDALALFDGASVRVEYDMHDDEHVWVSDANGRHICVATITERKGVVSHSRLEDQRAKRLQGQLKRLDKHRDEARDRATPAIDMDSVADKLDMGRGVELLEPVSQRNRRLTERLKTNNEPIIDFDIY